jgi:hypothetical protein
MLSKIFLEFEQNAAESLNNISKISKSQKELVVKTIV